MNSSQDFNCIFCQETFESKEELQIHFRKHGDPNFNQSKNKTRTQNEAQESNEKNTESNEMVGCDVCSEMFPTISKAITHKHKVHPAYDTKYFCPWCGKLFTLKHLYNKHLQTNHVGMEKTNDPSFHCDCCDVDFYIPTAMLYHNKFFHRQDTDLPAIGHSKKLKTVNQEVFQIYYCPFCGEEYDNKVNLHKHVTDDHIDENQSPEEVLRCPLCDAIFYHLDAYEVHLTYHSFQDKYSEENELMGKVTEFSLEEVPPTHENVEPCETQEDPEAYINKMGIDKFLELALNESGDTPKTDKVKKHKKHKKSKKAAITLDEFLNMNKDVFGEEIDFQGVEEIPSQVVAKQLKPNKKASKANSHPELERLKKHGIIVKKPIGVNIRPEGIKVRKVIPNKSIKSVQDNKMQQVRSSTLTTSNALSTSDEVLTKLMNQSNNQIKIVKKLPQADIKTPEKQNLDGKELDNIKINDVDTNENNKDFAKKLSGNEDISHSEVSNNTKDTSQDNQTIIKSPTPPSPSPEQSNNKSPNFQEIEDKAEIHDENLCSDSEVPRLLNKNDSNNVVTPNIEDDKRPDDAKQVNVEPSGNNCNMPLNALKHLNNITIKSVNQVKYTSTPLNSPKAKEINEDSRDTSINDDTKKVLPEKNMVNTLKNLGKNIIVKSVSQNSSNISKDVQKRYESDSDDNIDNIDHETNCNKPLTPIKVQPMNHSPKITNKTIINKDPCDEQRLNDDIKKSTNSTVKNLSGVNSKPASPIRSNQLVNTKGPSKVSNIKIEKKDDVEIYNIDDSDSEEEACKNEIQKEVQKPITNMNALKNLSKHITIKSVNQQKQINLDNENLVSECHDGDQVQLNAQSNSPKPMTHKSVINHALKQLGENIVVKSRHSSPSQSVKSQGQNSQDSFDHHDNDSDSDGCFNDVKITEMENSSDDELNSSYQTPKNKENQSNMSVKIQYPDESNSDNDDKIHEEPDDGSDIETQIKANTLKKIDMSLLSHANSVKMNSLKNISKDITIKSLNDNSANRASPKPTSSGNNNQLSIKPFKQPINECQKELPTNKSIKNASQLSSKVQQSVVNQKAATSNVNTVNKEVTVKTFQTQTKTVIQEITTTVTKTIKTVNQTEMKQEIRNTSQSNSVPTITPQKVQGMRTHPHSKNFQGMVVRHASPAVGCKVKNTPVRPMSTVVRPSNQLVPVRAGCNVARPSTPRMPSIRNVRPPIMNQQRPPQIGKPLKISPNAVIPSTKRPNTEEPTGHFSCFKKPKESLIPVSDIPTFSNDDGEANVQFTSAHMSKSNFTSTTKTVKGNSVVTSMQMKSETSTSTQQLNRLRNVTGLSVIKTSQSKAQVEEKCEVNASKRNTLEAIQKLQRQGLLVKKPRLDVNEDSDHSNPPDPEELDNAAYYSNEEDNE